MFPTGSLPHGIPFKPGPHSRAEAERRMKLSTELAIRNLGISTSSTLSNQGQAGTGARSEGVGLRAANILRLLGIIIVSTSAALYLQSGGSGYFVSEYPQTILQPNALRRVATIREAGTVGSGTKVVTQHPKLGADTSAFGREVQSLYVGSPSEDKAAGAAEDRSSVAAKGSCGKAGTKCQSRLEGHLKTMCSLLATSVFPQPRLHVSDQEVSITASALAFEFQTIRSRGNTCASPASQLRRRAGDITVDANSGAGQPNMKDYVNLSVHVSLEEMHLPYNFTGMVDTDDVQLVQSRSASQWSANGLSAIDTEFKEHAEVPQNMFGVAPVAQQPTLDELVEHQGENPPATQFELHNVSLNEPSFDFSSQYCEAPVEDVLHHLVANETQILLQTEPPTNLFQERGVSPPPQYQQPVSVDFDVAHYFQSSMQSAKENDTKYSIEQYPEVRDSGNGTLQHADRSYEPSTYSTWDSSVQLWNLEQPAHIMQQHFEQSWNSVQYNSQGETKEFLQLFSPWYGQWPHSNQLQTSAYLSGAYSSEQSVVQSSQVNNSLGYPVSSIYDAEPDDSARVSSPRICSYTEHYVQLFSQPFVQLQTVTAEVYNASLMIGANSYTVNSLHQNYHITWAGTLMAKLQEAILLTKELNNVLATCVDASGGHVQSGARTEVRLDTKSSQLDRTATFVAISTKLRDQVHSFVRCAVTKCQTLSPSLLSLRNLGSVSEAFVGVALFAVVAVWLLQEVLSVARRALGYLGRCQSIIAKRRTGSDQLRRVPRDMQQSCDGGHTADARCAASSNVAQVKLPDAGRRQLGDSSEVVGEDCFDAGVPPDGMALAGFAVAAATRPEGLAASTGGLLRDVGAADVGNDGTAALAAVHVGTYPAAITNPSAHLCQNPIPTAISDHCRPMDSVGTNESGDTGDASCTRPPAVDVCWPEAHQRVYHDEDMSSQSTVKWPHTVSHVQSPTSEAPIVSSTRARNLHTAASNACASQGALVGTSDQPRPLGGGYVSQVAGGAVDVDEIFAHTVAEQAQVAPTLQQPASAAPVAEDNPRLQMPQAPPGPQQPCTTSAAVSQDMEVLCGAPTAPSIDGQAGEEGAPEQGSIHSSSGQSNPRQPQDQGQLIADSDGRSTPALESKLHGGQAGASPRASRSGQLGLLEQFQQLEKEHRLFTAAQAQHGAGAGNRVPRVRTKRHSDFNMASTRSLAWRGDEGPPPGHRNGGADQQPATPTHHSFAAFPQATLCNGHASIRYEPLVYNELWGHPPSRLQPLHDSSRRGGTKAVLESPHVPDFTSPQPRLPTPAKGCNPDGSPVGLKQLIRPTQSSIPNKPSKRTAIARKAHPDSGIPRRSSAPRPTALRGQLPRKCRHLSLDMCHEGLMAKDQIRKRGSGLGAGGMCGRGEPDCGGGDGRGRYAKVPRVAQRLGDVDEGSSTPITRPADARSRAKDSPQGAGDLEATPKVLALNERHVALLEAAAADEADVPYDPWLLSWIPSPRAFPPSHFHSLSLNTVHVKPGQLAKGVLKGRSKHRRDVLTSSLPVTSMQQSNHPLPSPKLFDKSVQGCHDAKHSGLLSEAAALCALDAERPILCTDQAGTRLVNGHAWWGGYAGVRAWQTADCSGQEACLANGRQSQESDREGQAITSLERSDYSYFPPSSTHRTVEVAAEFNMGGWSPQERVRQVSGSPALENTTVGWPTASRDPHVDEGLALLNGFDSLPRGWEMGSRSPYQTPQDIIRRSTQRHTSGGFTVDRKQPLRQLQGQIQTLGGVGIDAQDGLCKVLQYDG